MPARLRPTAPIASEAILVGDPGRALMLAQELLAQPKMSNHARGLWGYTGETEGGHGLTIQSTGMGGPSAAVVLHDLADLGVRRAVRIGTCTALRDLDVGDLIIVTAAQPFRGSFVVSDPTKEPRNEEALPDREMTEALCGTLGEAATLGTVVSLDTLHRSHPQPASLPGDVADMQTAAVLTTGADLGVATAALLIVVETDEGQHLDDEKLEAAAKRAGVVAATVLSPSS